MAKKVKDKFKKWDKNNNGGEMVYFVGGIGAAIYNFQAASDLSSYLLALPKAIIWPAYVVYKLLEFFYGVVN
ncbi:MAG: hypothetical protein M3P98_00895 [bacterium]|nr:hypothetical protein [bacterium]